MNKQRECSSRAAGLAVAACWLLPILLTVASTDQTPDGRLAGNVSSLLFAPLFLLLVTAAGDWLIARLLGVGEELPGRWLFAAGAGFGAFSIATLLVGLVVVPPPWATWCVLVALAFLLSVRTGRVLGFIRERASAFLGGRDYMRAALAAIVGLLLLLNLLRSFVPPVEYDEMEYHLAVPARYVREGRIAFISNNAYAGFPANVEMLFLDAMMMRGGVREGFALGRLINVSFGLLAACAVGACASAVFSRAAAMPAAAILYTWPALSHVTSVAYVEPALLFYVALALLAGYLYFRDGGRIPHLSLLAVSCGLAAGCKYPAALFLCVPAAVFVMIASGRKLVGRGLLFAGLALVVLSPWLIRNVAWTGNPVYPLLGKVFHSPTWSARKEARWSRAHAPRDYAPAGMWSSIRDTALERHPNEERYANQDRPYSMSVLLVLFLPLAFVRREWRKKAAVLLALELVAIAAWLLFTHRISRFLVPWLAPLVILNAAGVAALEGRRFIGVLLAAALVLFTAFEAWATFRIRAPRGEMALLLGGPEPDEVLRLLTGPATYDHEAILFINRLRPPSKTLFYGEAQTLYATGDIIAPAVFDENPLDEIIRSAGSADDILAGLRKLGVTHVYVNLAELHRLQWSYAFRHGGKDWHGYCTLREEDQWKANWSRFLETHARIVYPFVSPEAWARLLARHGNAFHPAPRPDATWPDFMAWSFVHVMSHSDEKPPLSVPTPVCVYEIR